VAASSVRKPAGSPRRSCEALATSTSRGVRAGRARLGTRALAARRRPGQPGRMAHDRGAPQRDRSLRREKRYQEKVAELEKQSDQNIAAIGGHAVPGREQLRGAGRAARAHLHVLPSALAREAQVALTLRSVAGLTTREIARAFLVPRRPSRSAWCAQNARSSTASIPFRVPSPDQLGERVNECSRCCT